MPGKLGNQFDGFSCAVYVGASAGVCRQRKFTGIKPDGEGEESRTIIDARDASAFLPLLFAARNCETML
jgi:hypothetical protein